MLILCIILSAIRVLKEDVEEEKERTNYKEVKIRQQIDTIEDQKSYISELNKQLREFAENDRNETERLRLENFKVDTAKSFVSESESSTASLASDEESITRQSEFATPKTGMLECLTLRQFRLF